MGLMTGKKGIIFGVSNKRGIGYAISKKLFDEGAEIGAPKYMEWYATFGLLVTLIWLYIEILRLLSKLNSRR